MKNIELRKQIWEALKVDDSTRLMNLLETECKVRHLPLEELMRQLEDILWKNDNINRGNDKKGLIVVCAGNQRGIPSEKGGALQCLSSLLTRLPPESCSRYQIKRAYYSALYHGREEAAGLLQKHLEFFLD